MTNLTATKRNGEVVPFNIDKIKQAIKWACNNLDVDPLELEAKISTIFVDEIKTTTIQENTINAAINLTSIDNPDWKLVAGRLLMMNHWKETRLKRGYFYGDYYSHLVNFTNSGKYDSSILREYSKDELNEANTWINSELDLNYDYAGCSILVNSTLNKRYLIDGELLQEAYLTIALLLATKDKSNISKLERAKQYYFFLAHKKISLATPFLINLRVPGGNASSCFVLATDDNLDSLYDNIKKIAQISKAGGGVGISLDKVRSRGSWVKGLENASGGILPYCKVINDTALHIDQGSRRSGAVTVSVPIWHLDVVDFLDIQKEGEGGDLRTKCFDIFPQISIPDEFMRRCEANEDWTLIDPYEVRKKLGIEIDDLWGESFEDVFKLIELKLNADNKSLDSEYINLFKKVPAKSIMKQIMQTQLETGLPYLFFRDTWNKYNPNKNGIIRSTNLCVESTSVVKPDDESHVCSLLSLNLSNLYLEDIPDACNNAVRILNAAIDLTTTPTDCTTNHNDLYRVIGIGYMGMHDHLAMNDYNYTTGKDYISLISETIAYFSYKESIELAKEIGSFSNFNNSEFSKGIILGKLFYENKYILISDLNKYYNSEFIKYCTNNEDTISSLFNININNIPIYNCNYDWTEVRKNVVNGIANSQLLAIAPNTSTALIQGCTASVLPVFSKFFIEKTSRGNLPMIPPYLKDKFWYYTENKNTDQQYLVEVISEIQKFVDTGISLELLFNLNDEKIDARYIYDTIIKAWKYEIKALYYIRSVDKQSNESCESCSG